MKTFQIIFKSLISMALLLVLIGCSIYDEDPGNDPNLNENLVPDAIITLGEETGKIDVTLGMLNNSDQSISEINNFNGSWVLLNSMSEIRARGAVLSIGPIEPNGSTYPLVYSTTLEPGKYTLKWGALSVGTVTIDFEVGGDEDNLWVGISSKETSDAFLIEPEFQTTDESPDA
jgi:hypothetical protein